MKQTSCLTRAFTNVFSQPAVLGTLLLATTFYTEKAKGVDDGGGGSELDEFIRNSNLTLPEFYGKWTGPFARTCARSQCTLSYAQTQLSMRTGAAEL